jgi:hypothetical protein
LNLLWCALPIKYFLDLFLRHLIFPEWTSVQASVVMYLSPPTQLAVVITTLTLDYVAALDQLYHSLTPGTILNLVFFLYLYIDFLLMVFIFFAGGPFMALGDTFFANILLALRAYKI